MPGLVYLKYSNVYFKILMNFAFVFLLVLLSWVKFLREGAEACITNISLNEK